MNSDKRIWNALKLAAPLLDLGLTSEDSDSIQGLLNLHAKSLMTEFIKINGWRDLQVIDLILLIIEKYGVQLADLAQMRIWHKRRNKYYIEKKHGLQLKLTIGGATVLCLADRDILFNRRQLICK